MTIKHMTKQGVGEQGNGKPPPPKQSKGAKIVSQSKERRPVDFQKK